MRIIPIFIPHLGCPNDCVFCNQRSIASPSVPSAEQVREQIEAALKHSHLPQIAFYGGSFTAISKDRQEEYLNAACDFIKAGRASSIRISTRPDCIDGAVLGTLKKYGVTAVELGAQSMDERVLALSKRGHTAAEVRAASKMIKEAGFELGLQVMCGLPGGSRAEARCTALAAAELRPDFARIYPVCVIKNTELERMWRSGEYEPISIEQATEIAADMLEIFESTGIPVIRIGLNPTEDLSSGEAMCGAYHPALGELVRGRAIRRQIEKQLPQEGEYIVEVPKGKLSLYRGQKNCNVLYFAQKYPRLRVIFNVNS